MKPEKLASFMLSPPTGDQGLPIAPFLILQVTLTAKIYYQQSDDDVEQMLMRFSTDAGEAIWALGRSLEFSYRDLRGTLTLRVHVGKEGLQPAALAVVHDQPNFLSWLSLGPVPEDIIVRLPGDVAAEIRLNQASKFAGDAP